MRVKPRVLGVPLHPLLVHFPIAFWLAVPVLESAAVCAGPEPWWTLAKEATIIGIVTGAAAIGAGLLEYLQPSLAGINLRLAAQHGRPSHGACSRQKPWPPRFYRLPDGR